MRLERCDIVVFMYIVGIQPHEPFNRFGVTKSFYSSFLKKFKTTVVVDGEPKIDII